MSFAGKTVLSRLWAIAAILCMVATLNIAYASTQSSLRILEHQASGDTVLPDGGWLSACEGPFGICSGHMELASQPGDADTLDLTHHHHSGETHAGTLPDTGVSLKAPIVSLLALRPDGAACLAGRWPATIDQPPRVLSVI